MPNKKKSKENLSDINEAKKFIEELEVLIDDRTLISKEFKEAFLKSESRLRTIFDQSPFSIQICSPEGKTLMVNESYKRLWAMEDDFVENYILKDYNILEDENLKASGAFDLITRGFKGERVKIPAFYYENKVLGNNTRGRWAEGFIHPLKDAKENIREIVIIHTDQTELFQSQEREKFISDVAAILLTSIDYNQTIELIASATIPRFADGCIVDIVENGKINRLFTKHTSPEIAEVMKELQKKFPPQIDGTQPTPRVIASGKPEILTILRDDLIKDRTTNADHMNLIKKSGMHSHLAVPLILRGHVLGTLNWWITSNRPAFVEEDVQVGLEIAHYTAMALDNAKLFRDAKKALKQRDDFISIASHELKTPLTSLKLQMEILKRSLHEPDPIILQRVSEATNRQLDRMSRLVDDMLDISRISKGRIVREMSKVNLSLLILEVVEKFKDQFHHLQIENKLFIPKDIFVSCDSFRMEQVITNLISNAIRYGNKKPIEISLFQDEKAVFFKVRDYGIGIAPENHSRIFNAFERANPGHDFNGLGLGLFISKQIIEEHSGEISVDSTLYTGATFTVSLKRL